MGDATAAAAEFETHPEWFAVGHCAYSVVKLVPGECIGDAGGTASVRAIPARQCKVTGRWTTTLTLSTTICAHPADAAVVGRAALKHVARVLGTK